MLILLRISMNKTDSSALKKNNFMKTSALLFILIFCSFLSTAQQQQYKKLRVYLDGRPTTALMQTGITCDHGIHKKQVYFESDFSVADIQVLL